MARKFFPKGSVIHVPHVPAFFRRPLPKFARVRQSFSTEHIGDPASAVQAQLEQKKMLARIKPGGRIAITAGSRGMGGLIPILSGIAAAVKTYGGEPFIIPAMGSHAGAEARGQQDLLQRLGITEQNVGAPIRPTMETIMLGRAENGAEVYLDKEAAAADGIIVLGRTKTHPSSAAVLASGLLKMCVVGLGKQRGAQEAHNHGLWESVRAVPRVLMQHAKIVCGVAVVENAFRQPLRIEVVEPRYEAFLESDMRLLKTAKEHLARIPFEQLDVLVVDELGKNISGTGMDPNVIGHWRLNGGEHVPNFHRLVVLALTAPSMGNGLGIGMADFTTERFARHFDPAVTYINVLTSVEDKNNPREGSLPLACATDREAIETALYASLAGEAPRICRIRSTAELSEFHASEALLDEVRNKTGLSILSAPEEFSFNAAGDLF